MDEMSPSQQQRSAEDSPGTYLVRRRRSNREATVLGALCTVFIGSLAAMVIGPGGVMIGCASGLLVIWFLRRLGDSFNPFR